MERYSDIMYDQKELLRQITEMFIGTAEFTLPDVINDILLNKRIPMNSLFFFNTLGPTLLFLWCLTACKYSRVALAFAFYCLNYRIFAVIAIVTAIYSFILRTPPSSEVEAAVDEARWNATVFMAFAGLTLWVAYSGEVPWVVLATASMALILRSLWIVLPTVRLHSTSNMLAYALMAAIFVALSLMMYKAQYFSLDRVVFWMRTGIFSVQTELSVLQRISEAIETSMIREYVGELPEDLLMIIPPAYTRSVPLREVLQGRAPAVDHTLALYMAACVVMAVSAFVYVMTVLTENYGTQISRAASAAEYQNKDFTWTRPSVVMYLTLMCRTDWIFVSCLTLIVTAATTGPMSLLWMVPFYFALIMIAVEVWRLVVEPVMALEGTNTAKMNEHVDHDQMQCNYGRTAYLNALRTVIVLGSVAMATVAVYGYGHTVLPITMIFSAFWALGITSRPNWTNEHNYLAFAIGVATCQPGLVMYATSTRWVSVPNLWTRGR